MARFNVDAVEKPEYKEVPELPTEEPAAAATPAEGSADEAAPAAASADAPASGEPAADAAPTEDATTTAADAGASGDAAADAAAEVEAKKKADREALIAKRKEIEDENKRLRDEYEALMAAGQEKVADLNARFGDWYFVISNDVYKQIHLGRDEVDQEERAAEGRGRKRRCRRGAGRDVGITRFERTWRVAG